MQEKTVLVSGKEVRFRSSAAVPRLYRIKFKRDIFKDLSKLEKENTGFCVIVIDPGKFMPIEQFKDEVDRYVRMMKDGRKAPGVQEIFLPGEIEYRKFDEMKKTGFAVSEALARELTELSISLGAVEEGTDFAGLVAHFNA